MRLNETNPVRVESAIAKSGISDMREVAEIAADFLNDTYWNDPKCAGRRIRACGGDSARFFDSLPEVEW